MALTKNLSRKEKTLKLAAKLCLGNFAADFLDPYTAEDLGLSDEDFAIFEDQFKNVVYELCRDLSPAPFIKQNLKIAKDYYADK